MKELRVKLTTAVPRPSSNRVTSSDCLVRSFPCCAFFLIGDSTSPRSLFLLQLLGRALGCHTFFCIAGRLFLSLCTQLDRVFFASLSPPMSLKVCEIIFASKSMTLTDDQAEIETWAAALEAYGNQDYDEALR
jgi:hypothetical protein